MKSWATPIYERKEGKKDALLNLDDKTERLERTYGQIRASGAKIHALLKVGDDWEFHKVTNHACHELIIIVSFRITCHFSKLTVHLHNGGLMWIMLMKW